MDESDAWSLTIAVMPFVAPATAFFLGHRGTKWGWAISLAFVAALGWLLLMNFIFEKPEEWALVLAVSIPWWPVFFGGAILGNYIGKITRPTED